MDAFPTPMTTTHGPDADARLAAFATEVERVRAEVEPELFFHPNRPKPCTVNGATCRTSVDVIAAYAPSDKHTCTPAEWQRISEIVRDCVRLAATPSATSALARMQVTTDFVLWCLRNDVPLHAEMMFTPARVEQYVATQLAHRSQRSQAAVRTTLRAVGRASTVKAGWDRPSTPLESRRRVEAPYTDEEIAAYWEAAAAQQTHHRRHVMGTILTLGLGAGLTNSEMFELRTSQVLEHPLHEELLVLALVDRLVPVRADVADTLRLLCDEQPTGRLIGGHAEQVNNRTQLQRMVANLTLPPSAPPLAIHRLRTTWLVSCLSGGMNTAELCVAAGFSMTHATTLTRYLPFVQVRDDWMALAAGFPIASEARA